MDKLDKLNDILKCFFLQKHLGKQFTYALFSGFMFLLGLPSIAQKSYILGKVVDKMTGKPLPAATVVNKATKQITKTGENGNFLVRASKGDSIKISLIGYKIVGIAWDGLGLDPLIELQQDAIALKEVVVRDKRLEQVRQQIEELMGSPEAQTHLKWNDITNLIQPNETSPGTIGISIDGIYDLFSKEGKSRRRLAAMKQDDLRKLLVEYRYNAQYISFVTKLRGQKLNNFIKFCNLPDNFVLTANDYDLTFEIYRCLEEFER